MARNVGGAVVQSLAEKRASYARIWAGPNAGGAFPIVMAKPYAGYPAGARQCVASKMAAAPVTTSLRISSGMKFAGL